MTVNALIFTELMAAWFPTTRAAGAYRIASEIRSAGYSCQVVDFFTKFSDEEMDKVISSFVGADTLIVGFSSTFFEKFSEFRGVPKVVTLQHRNEQYTNDYPYSREKMEVWFNKIKKINPNIKIVFGGGKAQFLENLKRSNTMADAFAIGFCDQAIVEYMQFLQGKNPFFQYEKVTDTQLAFYGSRYPKFDFKNSVINWHKSDMLQHGETVPIEIGRGCIFSCSFCSAPLIGKKKLEYVKSADTLRNEFIRNYQEFGISRYIYCDDTHNDSTDKIEYLHSVVTSLPFEIEYAAYMRIDLLNAHRYTAKLLRESGARSVFFGIESLYHPAAKSIGKGIHPEKIKEVLYWLRDDVWKDEVGLGAGFIVGLPKETPETARVWLDWLLNKDCPLDSYELNTLMLSRRSMGEWTSEFQRNSEAHGYKFDANGNWVSDHFTFDSALALVNEYLNATADTNRMRLAGFPPLLLATLGFAPKDIIGLERRPFMVDNKIQQLKVEYIDRYKKRILNE